MIHTHRERLDYPQDASLTDVLLEHNLNNTPHDKPAIIDGLSGEVVFTYSSFRTGVRQVARHFHYELGIGPGVTVGIFSTNRNYYPVCVHGILATGAVVSALNPAYSPAEIVHALRLSRPSHLLVEKELLPPLLKSFDLGLDLPWLPAVHVWDADHSVSGVCAALDVEAILRHGSADYQPAKFPPGTAAQRPAFVCFSSGTSGLVKGVRLSHGNIVANIFQQAQGLQGMFTPATVMALIVPFFHILGLAGFSCQYVCQGAPIVAFKRFQMEPLLKAIKLHKVTHINIVPPIALEFLQNPLVATGDFSSLQCLANAAAPLSPLQARALSAKLGCVVTSWYGMTEASPSIASQREDEATIAGTVGRLLPGIELRILDEHGHGEFAIRGPNLMQGYVTGEVQPGSSTSSAVTPDRFLKTGDIGYIDKDGYLFIVDRAKEMIKVKGHQVAPAELEALLMAHPMVNDAAVCGIYDEQAASEFPIAYIATTEAGRADPKRLEAELLVHVHARVAKYKQLVGGIHILQQIPRNPSGKILRRLLPANLDKKRQGAAASFPRPAQAAKL
ncbi:hypothetical protein SEUCBS140593_005519 [Sporothrix eucalyptigena]|uniref:Acetyl-CoA synthetase-like protein n=1 Tax=Sporothrix eucalyptigena TaxID=1812306 RepID=A0ABP0BX29_9PEZI